LEFDICNAHSRRVSTPGKLCLFLSYVYPILILVLQAVDEFVYELRLKEANTEKRHKLAALALDEEEWTRVRLFCNILQVRTVVINHLAPLTLPLQHADNAQHAFSTASRPTLHNALLALEKLYAEWEKALRKPRYKSFVPALTAGMVKLDEYYKRSGTSDAHLMAIGE